jgi:hypothetical protein
MMRRFGLLQAEVKFAALTEDSDNRIMTSVAQHIVEDFASLPDREKREVLANLLRISRDIDFPELSDEEFVASADAVFLEYDRRESDQ